MGFHEWLSHDNFFELNPSFSRNGGPPRSSKAKAPRSSIDEAIQFHRRAKKAGKTVLHRRLVRLAA
jgi:hypothetical protein